ncbi:MAG: ketol-acid reductoisomerase, partial [Solirubrobacteraceae bacterium]|nr:ketol-acid reductoisomerase [Solirubrobacteraceae bacterium]
MLAYLSWHRAAAGVAQDAYEQALERFHRSLAHRPPSGFRSSAAMRQILKEIQDGDFAREWIAENRAGQENFKRMRAEQADSQVEHVGGELR